MSTKALTGWLLIAGPILTFLVIGILYDAVIGPGETNAEAVKEALAKAQTARLFGLIGMVAFVSTYIGMTLLARTMQEGDKAGTPFAVLAGIVFAGVAAIAILASGLGLGAMDTAKDSVSDAATIGLIGDGIFASLFVFWGIGNILIGGATVAQKNLPPLVGWLFVGWGVFMVAVSAMESAEIPDAVGLFLWAGINLTMVVAGILTLREKQAG